MNSSDYSLYRLFYSGCVRNNCCCWLPDFAM